MSAAFDIAYDLFKDIEQDLFRDSTASNPQKLIEYAKEWAGFVADDVGKDQAGFSAPADQSYLDRLKPYIDTVNQNTDLSHARIILNELSEAVQSQRSVADFINRAAIGNSHTDRTSLFANPSMPERQWIKSPLALIDFLKQPLSEVTAAAFSESQTGFFPSSQVHYFYNDFWSMPFARQTAFVQAVLDDPRHGGYKRLLNAIKGNQIIQDFLPPDGGESSAFQNGKLIINAFAVTAPLDLSAEAVTSLLDAVRTDLLDQQSAAPRATTEDERFGYRLGGFMRNLGPGADKTTQYGHSLPTTKDAWMPGLAPSKTDSDRANRADFLRWADESVPDEVKSHIDRVTDYKGTGAYVATYGVKFDPAYIAANPLYGTVAPQDDLVLAVLKPNARERSLKFIDYLLRLGETARRFSADAFRSVAPLLEIVKQGRSRGEQETDLRHSIPQERLSAEYFDKIKMMIGKLPFSFFTQGAFDCGEKFRVSLEVKGPHFNQLPELTKEQRTFKRQTAIALFVAAANMCLRGKPFNHDIHGDNEGVDFRNGVVRVGMFDSGALDVDAPTTAQKRMLADCLFNALANTLRNGYGPVSSLKHTIAKTAEAIGPDRQAELDYANTVLRAFLSIGDYMRHMRKRDFLLAGRAILKAGDLDRDMTTRLCDRAKALVATLVLPKRQSQQYEAELEQKAQFYSRNPKPKRAKRTQPTPHVPAQAKALKRILSKGWLGVQFNLV